VAKELVAVDDCHVRKLVPYDFPALKITLTAAVVAA